MMVLHSAPESGYGEAMVRATTLGVLAALAQDQWGLFTRRQAELANIPKTTFERLVASDSVIERVAHGVYRFVATPIPEHLELRAAWLQLAPEVRARLRTSEQGLVSHRSAAALYGLGELPADRHEFTLPERKQTRRDDVRIHRQSITDGEWTHLGGMLVTRPSRIAADLLADREDPGAVARIIAEAIREIYDYPGTFAESLSPLSAQFGLRRDDGYSLLRWLLELVDAPQTPRWLDEARESMDRRATSAPDSAKGVA
jgi:hypothetical protein